MCKTGICDTKPAIYLKRSSLQPQLLQSVYRNLCTAQIWRPRVNFGLLFRGAKFFHNYFSHIFCQSATKFGRVRGLANRNLFPEFRELWSEGPVIPCVDMHQSFTGTLVKWFFDNFPTFAEMAVFVFFLFIALPEDQVQVLCTSALHRLEVATPIAPPPFRPRLPCSYLAKSRPQRGYWLPIL